MIGVELPKLGNTVEDCLITRWVKHAGDAVKAGDVIAEIETDKTTFEITAPADGVVLKTFFDEGALVPVFATLCLVGDAGESVGDGVRDSGFGTRGTDERHVAQPAVPAPVLRTPNSESRIPAAAAFSPRASRYIAEHHFDATGIRGSGPGGRVLEKDVRQAYESRSASPRIPNPESRIPSALSSVRATIARRMKDSLASTAQYTLHATADATALLAARARAKTHAASAGVNINHLISFCTIRALVESPEINAEYIDGRIVSHADVHLAFACDTPRGLVAPVVHDAHRLPLAELAARMNALTTQAVEGTVAPQDVSGGTFTISNLGSLGVEFFTPIVNQPQVAILGVGAIRHDRIGLSLTCDHQVIDGAPGARFLQRVKDRIEQLTTQNS